MKLPTIWLALCFAGGILLYGSVSQLVYAPPRFILFAAVSALVLGFIAMVRSWIICASVAALSAWLFLGCAAAACQRAAIPANRASSLIDSGKLDSSVALRWRGRLREDPLQLPWGRRYLIDLEEVESEGGVLPVSGGLRLNSYGKEPAPAEAFEPASEQPPDREFEHAFEPVFAGSRVEILARIAPVRNFGNPGSFDLRGYLARIGVDVQGSLRSERLLTVLSAPRPTIGNRLSRARGRLLHSIDTLFASHPEQGSLARAMLLGDRSFVEHDRVVAYQKTGVYHVLVLAGLHVAALILFLSWVARLLRMPLVGRTLLILLVLAAYLGIVEDRPPILRAAIMATIYLSGRLLYRPIDMLNTAALAAMLILAARPNEITDPSFVLTFSAITVIGALAVPWLEHSTDPLLRGLGNLSAVDRDVSHPPRVIQFRIEMRAAIAVCAAFLPAGMHVFIGRLLVLLTRVALGTWELIVLSSVLQLGMLPAMAYYFHRVTLAGPLANVLAVTLTGAIVPLGFVTLGASFAFPALARWLAKDLGILLYALDSSVQKFAAWRGMSYRVPETGAILIVLFAAMAILLSASIRARSRIWQVGSGLALCILAILIATDPFPAHLSRNNLEVTVLDVGQGDSLFISFPDLHTMLVDGGGSLGNMGGGGMHSGIDTGEDIVSPYLWSRGIKEIEVVALTHAHQDHLGGLHAILENFRVRQLWLGRSADSAPFQNLLATAREHGVEIHYLKQGDTFTRGDVSASVLWPEDDAGNRSPKNDDSLVIRLTEGTQSMLLPGDIERPSERKILAEDQTVSANFLKVAHHGSKTSTIEPFLLNVHPTFAAISVGKDNSFGHPAADVLERLEAAGVRVYRTDREGAISIVSNGKALTASTFLHPQLDHQAVLSDAKASSSQARPSLP